MILVGPSGCGKTTALRCVAGLEKPTSGTIRVGDRVVNDVPPRDRDIAMVFQNYALYPHMTVYKNLAFGLKQRKTDKAEIDRRVSSVSTMLGLDDLLKRRPAQLSGGQRQRVAMGRALVREPSAFLLDEPLSNLDAKLRVQMRAELKRLHTRLGITTVYVTHDQIEAMTLGDRIAVMSNGKLQQLGPPQELYDEPTNLFVAGFIGSPPMNLIRGRADGGRVTAGDLTFERGGVADGDVAVGIRPETVVAAERRPAVLRVPGRRRGAARRRGGGPRLDRGHDRRDRRRGRGAPDDARGLARADHGPVRPGRAVPAGRPPAPRGSARPPAPVRPADRRRDPLSRATPRVQPARPGTIRRAFSA